MDKQSKAPGVYRVILCVLTLVLAPVFYAIWQPYNTCLLQLPWIGRPGVGGSYGYPHRRRVAGAAALRQGRDCGV